MRCFAVEAENLVYNCDRNTIILNGLTSYIQSQSIYGLIGPSGCGKTTFLRCIIGLTRPTGGSLKIFGLPKLSPSCLGYMPQDLSLYADLTIGQTTIYFGRLNMLPVNYIKEKMRQLTTMLDLPEESRLVTKLSIGQQRRLSFMCAVIHAPKLLILDEPTVGCDPITCEAILSYLTSLKSRKVSTSAWLSFELFRPFEQATIIITTHYIEEARRCDAVGFMREGRILLEGNPYSLMGLLNVSKLEDAFVILCKLDGEKGTRQLQRCLERSDDTASDLRTVETSAMPRHCQSHLRKISHDLIKYLFLIRVLVRRNSQQILTHKSGLISYFVCTSVLLFLWTQCHGLTPKKLLVGVVRDESDPFSWKIIESHNSFDIISFKSFNSTTSARTAVKKAEIHGYLHLGENFTYNLIAIQSDFAADEDNDYDGGFRELPGQLTYYSSGLNPIQSHTVEWVLTRIIETAVPEIVSKAANLSIPFSLRPVEIVQLYGKFSFSDMFNRKQNHIPSAMIFCCYVTTLVYFAAFFFREVTEESLNRNLSSGVSSSQVLLSCLITMFTVIMVINSSIFLVPLIVFDVPVTGSLLELVAIQLLNQIASLLTSFLMATLRAQLNVILIVINAYLFIGMYVTGWLTSWESIPYFFKLFRYFYPYLEPRDAAVEIVMKGNSLADSSLLRSHFINSIMYSIVVFSLILLRIGCLRNQ